MEGKATKDWRFWVFLILSIIWSIRVFWLLIEDQYFSSFSGAMPLNEVGDFLAGSFSPLAFAWLAYGYWMQNKELKLNRRSLEKQIEEFEKSVKNQEEHFNLVKEKENYDKNVKLFQSRPILSISKAYHSEVMDQSRAAHYDVDPNYDAVIFFIKNDGEEIFNISLKLHNDKTISNRTLTNIGRSHEIKIYIQEPKIPKNFFLEVSYDSKLGERALEHYSFDEYVNEHNPPDFIEHEQGHQEVQISLTVNKITDSSDGN
ncbi:hypothetical protein [Marinomonas atlantica]|uniref:hypothetical protein n=1 Tax=Marinomonas atlantica TaxID=1806668 RepID=UPI0008376F2E|nr:hypothetical protein [Marinomonas atlantica]